MFSGRRTYSTLSNWTHSFGIIRPTSLTYRHTDTLHIDIVVKRIYLFNIVAWNYRKKTGFPVCKKENFAGLQAHRKRGKSASASPAPHHKLNEERSARFTAQHLSALPVIFQSRISHQFCSEISNISKIQLVIYYQCCVLIGRTTTSNEKRGLFGGKKD